MALAFCACAVPSPAYFAPAGLGVRPAALGGAFVAVADDANAVLFNPAGYAGLEHIELVSMYSELYAGFNARLFTGELDRTGYGLLSAAVPVSADIGTLGLAWARLDSLIYAENTYALSYGRSLGFIPLDLGISLKMLQWQVAENEFTTRRNYYPYAQHGKTGFTADLGMKMTPAENLSVAASVENLVPADVGLTRTEIVPMVVRVGAAYRVELRQPFLDRVLVSGQLDWREDQTNEVLTPRLGVETLHAGLFAFRAGIASRDVSAGAGLSYRWPRTPLGVQLDYAFDYPLQLPGTGGSHRVGLKIQWNPKTSRMIENQAGDEQSAIVQSESPAEASAVAVDAQAVNLTAAVIAAPAYPAEPLIPDRNPRKIVIGIDQALIGQTADRTAELAVVMAAANEQAGMPVEQRILGSEEMKKQFLLGWLDIVVSYNEYFHEFSRNGLLRPAVVARSQGKPTIQYYLYVSQDSPVESKEQLQGKRLGCLNNEKVKYLKTLLYPNVPGFDENRYFENIIVFSTPMEAVLALQMGTVDTLLGRDQEYRLDAGTNGEGGVKIRGELKPIAASGPLPNAPVFIKRAGGEKKQAGLDRLVALMLAAHQNQRLRGVLNQWGIDRLVPFDEQKYRDYFNLR